MILIQTTHLRPRSWTILLALIPVIAYMSIAGTVSGDTTLQLLFGLMLLVPIGLYIFTIKSYIEFDNDGITHKNPFRKKSMQWKEVQESYFRIIHTGKSSKRMWYFENPQYRLAFATRLYSRTSLRTIAEALVAKCPDAYIGEKIRNIAEGKFPWYIF